MDIHELIKERAMSPEAKLVAIGLAHLPPGEHHITDLEKELGMRRGTIAKHQKALRVRGLNVSKEDQFEIFEMPADCALRPPKKAASSRKKKVAVKK